MNALLASALAFELKIFSDTDEKTSGKIFLELSNQYKHLSSNMVLSMSRHIFTITM
jgi:hypothetical protein